MSNQPVIESLKYVLADSYALYLKTHTYHWNVTGPQFHALHALFDEQYTDLFNAVDMIAERIRMLGEPVNVTFTRINEDKTITDPNPALSAHQMVEDLQGDQDRIIRTLRRALDAAEQASDDVTVDLMIRRMEAHEKNAWMLRALAA